MLNRDKTQKIVFSIASDVGAGVLDATLLGVVLDSKLCWSSHVEMVRRRFSSHIFLLRQIKRITTENIQLSVYFALIHSQLSYGVVLWGNSGAAVRLFRLQKRSVRIVAGAAPRESCRSYFSKYGIMTLPCLYIYYTLLEIHRYITSYKTQADNHCYNTRYANNLRIPKLRLTKSIKNTTNVNLYNVLPSQWRSLHYSLFKIRIKEFMLKYCFYSVDEFLRFDMRDV
ncbi:hypothetical protein QE152_g7140 [Popillia japonica]|uniref:Uncharacterized protein n=1 Tax=Popillia japonica TaxID=7064 RepID=A0AAW1MG23_POPJA